MAKKRQVTGSQKAGNLSEFNAKTGQLRDSKGRFTSKQDTQRILDETNNGTKNVKQVLEGQSRFTDYKKSIGVSKVGTSRKNDGRIESKSKTEDLLSIARELSKKGDFTQADVGTKYFNTKLAGGEKFEPSDPASTPLVSIPAFINSEVDGAWFELIDQYGNVSRTQDPEEAEMIARELMDEQMRIVEQLKEDAKEAGDDNFYAGAFFQIETTTWVGKESGKTKISMDFSQLAKPK